MPEPSGKSRLTGPVVFGEVLYDCFPDGTELLGGAPFNVAWHLQGFGLPPLLVSAIGDDRRGAGILDAMGDWGLSTDGIQIKTRQPTGTVEIRPDGAGHRFVIPADQAYDRIGSDDALAALSGVYPPLLYHGSLILRGPTSRGTLDLIRDSMALPVFLDVNLRSPWWQPATLTRYIDAARWLKLNEDELVQLTGGPAGRDGNAAAMMYERRLAALILTRGKKGALILADDGRVAESGTKPTPIVDTVGAGDAFSAVCILGLLSGWPLPSILERADTFAGRICGIRGAIAGDRSLYTDLLEQWQISHEQGA